MEFKVPPPKKTSKTYVIYWHDSHIENINAFIFGAWSFLLVHILFEPGEGPKGFVNLFILKQTMEVGPWSQIMEKGHFTWSDFMVHGVN